MEHRSPRSSIPMVRGDVASTLMGKPSANGPIASGRAIDPSRERGAALSEGPPQELVTAHRNAQDAARAVLRELAENIGPQDTEQSISRRAASALHAHGIRETWYYDCPALVLLGSRSCASPSGRTYAPARERVGATNLVTIDLSPSCDGYWGDCARSFFVEDGRVSSAPQLPDF